jgi:antitoxin component of MazEF toxin-antitoxin module
MIKKLIQVGDSQALLLDKALMESIGLREGEEVRIIIHDHAFTVAAVQCNVDDESFRRSMDQVLADHDEALRRLA